MKREVLEKGGTGVYMYIKRREKGGEKVKESERKYEMNMVGCHLGRQLSNVAGDGVFDLIPLLLPYLPSYSLHVNASGFLDPSFFGSARSSGLAQLYYTN